MKKLFLWLLIVAMIAVFSLASCKAEAAEEAVEVVEEEAEESETAEQQLLETCRKGNLEDVKRLLEQNTDVNAKDDEGGTALMGAAANGQTETADLLRKAGALE